MNLTLRQLKVTIALYLLKSQIKKKCLKIKKNIITKIGH